MNDWMRRLAFSLTSKILFIYIPLATASVAALLAAVAAHDYTSGVRQLRTQIEETARINAPVIADAIWQFKTDEVAAIAGGIASSSSILAVTIYDLNGSVISTVISESETSQPRNISVSEAIYAPATANALGRPLIGRIVIESNSRIVWNGIADKMMIGILYLAAMLLALIAATLVTTRMVIVRPLRLLEQSIAVGRTGQNATQVDWKSDDELGHVVAAYNEMIAFRSNAAAMLRQANEELENRVRRRTHELEDARDRAQAATEAKANFLAAMSHEIRTPMNGVVGMVDLLGETGLDDDQRKMVGTIKTSAYSLLGIIGDILDFSRLEAGRMRIEHTQISILDILESVGVTLWASSLKKGLMLPIYCDPNIPARVYGDPVRIRQILTNLIGNAIKFTETTLDRQGKVVIRADLVAEVMDRVQIRFSVADNGIGMDDDMKSRLFRPFEQADASTVRQYGGTGLGLSICKHLVALMGGAVAVESAPGSGSTFIVDLWFDAVADEKPETDLSGLRVLMLLRQQSGEAGEFLRRYITHWDATADIVYDRDACAKRLRDAARMDEQYDVLIVGTRLPRNEKEAFRNSLMTEPELETLRFVFLDYEYQRAPALLDRNTVTITAAPICRATFITGIAIACGRASPETQSLAEQRSLPKVRAPSVEEARAAGLLVLVAEDNETNQDVIRRQLTALGYASVVVENGQLALEEYRNGSYAVLLTDCHMPVMDGYRLTEIIRAEEAGTGRHIPIIAITANALHGEAERCLTVGMDDFVVKPVELHAFRRVLRRWLALPSTAAASIESIGDIDIGTPDPHIGSGIKTVLDLSILSRIVGGNSATIVEVLRDFEAPARKAVEEITAAFAKQDADAINFAAHKLKSAARTIGATALGDRCAAIEEAGAVSDVAALDALVPSLDAALEQVIDRISVALSEPGHAKA